MKLSELDCRCGDCPDELMSLCDRYTPYDNYGTPPLCQQSSLQDFDCEIDIEKIAESIKDWEAHEDK